MRELMRLRATYISYNRYPDEKGTESYRLFDKGCYLFYVTTVTPMKRGLKVESADNLLDFDGGYNRYPDEKGTERPRK